MVRNPWLVAAILVVFLIVLQQGLKFWRDPIVPEPVRKEIEVEAFTNPTSVLECRCLPGYQPSNSASSTKQRQLVQVVIPLDGGRKLYIPCLNFLGTKDIYEILGTTNDQQCLPELKEFSYSASNPGFVSIPLDDIILPGRQSTGTWKLIDRFQCSLLEQQTTRTLPYYQCQSINDPTKTRPCY